MKLTQEELAEMIKTVVTNIYKKREEAGKEAGEISTEEILAEINDIIGGGDGEPKSEEPKSDEPAAVTPEALADAVASVLAGMKAAETPTETKSEPAPAPDTKSAAPAEPETKSAEPAPAQRKYRDLFLSAGARPHGSNADGIKSRLSAMSAPERRRTAYGLFGRAVKCINASGGDIEKAAYTAERKFADPEMAHEFKALSATVPTDGGYLVPEVYANEIIELLYPATVIYALGARRLGMANGNLNIPKLKTGARAMFVGENRVIPKSAPKFGNLKLSAKKLTALIPMSNDLLRSTNFDNDVIVGQDITRQMALGIDSGALLGKGTEFEPLGILSNKKVQTIDVTALDALYAAGGKVTAAFPNYLVACVLKNNVYADGLGFVFNTSVEQWFKSLRDDVGGFIFAKEMNESHTLVGYPYRSTNLLETSASGQTSIIFGNWNDMIIGEQGALEIETSREGSWTDEAGNLVSAFENDQTLIRAIDNVDVGLRHDESFAVASKVTVPV